LATDGDVFARVDPNGDWSVRWDRVFDIAYSAPHPRQVAVQAYARLLRAAKDNFIVNPWDAPTAEWPHYPAIIDYVKHDPEPHTWQSTIRFNGNLIARVNYDGSWSVLWPVVFDVIVGATGFDHNAAALVGICRILKAAKDRFVTAAWDEPEEEE
jgi:hypothetical protein